MVAIRILAEIGLPISALAPAWRQSSATEREKARDPRPSIAKRYKDQGQYVRAIEQAARKLLQERLLLDEDVHAMSERARQMVWPPVPSEYYPFWQMRP